MILRGKGRASWVWDAWHHAGAEHVQLVLVDALVHARIWRRDDLEVLLRLLDDVRWLEKNEALWSLFEKRNKKFGTATNSNIFSAQFPIRALFSMSYKWLT